MRKNIVISLVIIIVGFGFANYAWIVDSGKTEISGEIIDAQKKLRSTPNKAFTVGEKLTFDIDWGPANVGTAVMAVPRIKKYNGRDVYEIRTQALSNKFISTVYRVDDQIVSYVDTAGIFSWRTEKELNEWSIFKGDWKQKRLFMFDHEKNLAYSLRDTVEIPEYCLDVISAFFYVRTQDLQVGKTIEIPHYDNDKVYYLTVEIQKKQQVRVPAGKFNCIVVEPKLKTQALFKHEGRIKIYLTDDEKKIPVMMVSKVTFGQIAAKLTKIETEILQ